MFIDPNKYGRGLGDGAAVDDHDFAVHETVSVADHEGRVLGELGRQADPSLRYPEVMHLEQPLGQGVAEVGIEDAGGDSIDGDPEVGGLA